MKHQSEQNTQLIKTVLESNAAQLELVKSQLELYRPREVRSTTLAEREAMKEQYLKDTPTAIRPSEWEPIKDLGSFLGTEVPPDPW